MVKRAVHSTKGLGCMYLYALYVSAKNLNGAGTNRYLFPDTSPSPYLLPILVH